MRYHVIDRHTGYVVGKYKTRKGANRAVDRLDNKYGGYKHQVKEIKVIKIPEACMETNDLDYV